MDNEDLHPLVGPRLQSSPAELICDSNVSPFTSSRSTSRAFLSAFTLTLLVLGLAVGFVNGVAECMCKEAYSKLMLLLYFHHDKKFPKKIFSVLVFLFLNLYCYSFYYQEKMFVFQIYVFSL